MIVHVKLEFDTSKDCYLKNKSIEEFEEYLKELQKENPVFCIGVTILKIVKIRD